MTYSTGNIILATDYNGFASATANANVDDLWGTGSGDKGYGQSTTLGTVAAAGTVTATNWSALCSRITSIAAHTGTSITSRTGPVTSDLIGILAALNTDLTNCNTNRGNAASSGTEYKTWTGSSAKTSATGSGSDAWTITFTHTVTFTTANAARYFFNAGGIIKWAVSKTSTGQLADAEWNDLAGTLCGQIYITGAAQTINAVSYTGTKKTGGTGTPTTLATSTGWYALTGTPVTIYKQFADTSPYTGQYIQINASATSTVLTLTTTWVDPGGSGVGSADNITGGTDTASPFTAFGTAPATVVTYIPPETTNLTATWGTPAIAAAIT